MVKDDDQQLRKLYNKLTKLLVNDDDDGLDFYKLLPTQPDRPAFQALIAGSSLPPGRFSEAFVFFCEKLRGTDSDGEPIDFIRMDDAIRNRLTVVAIHLGEFDDPYLIFESLNAKGAPLTQADLIRNYILLRLRADDQQKAYESAWLPMQNALGDHLTEFMRQYLMQSGEEVAKSSIYAVLKKRLLNIPDKEVMKELHEIHSASSLYAIIVGLSSATEAKIAERLKRLLRWEIATASPFVLKLLICHSKSKVTTENIVSCLKIIESFAVRRAVCAVPTNQLKKIFLSVAKDMPEEGDIASWLCEKLAAGASGRRWPKDEEFHESLYRYRAYAGPIDRCRFLLESLEVSYPNKERASFELATIEHIMPQTLTEAWRAALGQNAEEVHERLIDNIGNLTITAYNSELSNLKFADKKKLLEESHFCLNRWICEKSQWGEVEIRERVAEIFGRAVKIWPYANF
ncbi:hypothetical protein T281_09325 [Rhodomicrobium udaipurense JA643]|uniref:DUF262 domain-containing protein n=1 Tax=Rhodomicrobium udaipurense TaxID=1202716 RepID=A0A8I1KME6_9HYPH|nr:DUF262 domain-containing protein [Rhodomicrobium udaipurense]KAI94739.1 hypothetical protein T281_09325 [Rhodomicrobium udaipurense JA643]MBJ7545218.1 DUF262 domain-containing protein [Rhodomicrobium udaipurense]